MIREVRIPSKRVQLIKKNENKIRLNVKIQIAENIARIDGECLDVLRAESIIKAIARGFPIDEALSLLDEGKSLCIIQIPGNKKSRTRIKARIIGTHGRAKKKLEQMTNCSIAVSGKTVAIIGNDEDVVACRAAIEKFISGSPHKIVYSFLGRLKAS